MERIKNEKPVLQSENINGFTPQEEKVHNLLMQSFSEYQKLSVEHPDETQEYCTAVHAIQGLLTTRIARRCYPKGWPTYQFKAKKKIHINDSISGLGFSVRTSNCLRLSNIHTVGDLITKPESELTKHKGIARLVIAEIKKVLDLFEIDTAISG